MVLRGGLRKIYLVFNMNQRGQITIFYTFMIGITVIVLALAFAPTLKIFTNDAMDSSNLDCDNSSISYFDQSACIITDVSLFGFIGGLIFIVGSIIGARIVFSG